MAKVTLDKETFKALASDTRLAVLRSLDARRKTGSELARELQLNKATVHEHLQLLTSVGLVKKVDEGRKWIYYELTWQGQRLLRPEATTTFAVLLGGAAAATGGGFAFLGSALGWWFHGATTGASEEGAPMPEGMADGAQAAGAPPSNDTSEEAPPAEAGARPADRLEGGDLGDGVAEAGGSTFFDDGGWVALTLFAAALLCLLLAWWLRHRPLTRGRES